MFSQHLVLNNDTPPYTLTVFASAAINYCVILLSKIKNTGIVVLLLLFFVCLDNKQF